MEIIHDVAPGASQAFHTAFEGQASFAQGIIDLADAGAKVINDDVIYFAEPLYQDGIVAQAVDQVKARGVAYFSQPATTIGRPTSPPSVRAAVLRHRLRVRGGARLRSRCRRRYLPADHHPGRAGS